MGAASHKIAENRGFSTNSRWAKPSEVELTTAVNNSFFNQVFLSGKTSP
jgi:hypothetical protein